jgi:hypothetical protein
MARKPPTKVQTAKVSTAKSNKKAAAANTLKSALAYHAARENHDLLEGILHPDKNIPGNYPLPFFRAQILRNYPQF